MSYENCPRVRVAVVIVEEDRVLLVQHEHSGKRFWILPGGGLEFQETLRECGARELMEETGLEIRVGRFLFVAESIPSVVYPHVVILYYQGERLGGEMKLGDDDCLTDVRWFSREELSGICMYPDVKKQLLEVMSGKLAARTVASQSAVEAGLR